MFFFHQKIPTDVANVGLISPQGALCRGLDLSQDTDSSPEARDLGSVGVDMDGRGIGWRERMERNGMNAFPLCCSSHASLA